MAHFDTQHAFATIANEVLADQESNSQILELTDQIPRLSGLDGVAGRLEKQVLVFKALEISLRQMAQSQRGRDLVVSLMDQLMEDARAEGLVRLQLAAAGLSTAEIDSAIEGAMASKYRNAGQTCVCANRIYVQDAVYDEFVQKFSAKVKTLKVGNGFEDGVAQGPLIEDAAVEKVARHVQDAIAKGGKVMVGGHKLDGQFFEPTVIANASADMLCAREETFGPFAPVFRFHQDQEAIDAANNTEFGLASYFYTRDIGRIYRVSEALEYGMVGINVGVIATEHVPFGGVKQSGLGREGSSHGMDEYLEMKYLCLGDILK